MRLQQRSFSGPSFRPSPVTELESGLQLFMVATSWGEPDASARVISRIKDYMQMSADPDATVVGAKAEEVIRLDARMRSGAMLANDLLFQTDNTQEYKSAVELAFVSVQKNMLHWVQIGCPHILIASDKGLEPICYTPDWSWQLRQSSPLLGAALGLEKSCQLNCGSYRLTAGQSLVFISRNQLPPNLYSQQDASLDSLSRVLVDDNSDEPFWIAKLEI